MAGRDALRRSLLVGATALTWIANTDVAAFDGERKGFMVDLGLGTGYVADGLVGSTNARAGGGATINVGYGFNNRIAVFFSERAAAWRGDSQYAALAVSGLGVTVHFADEALSNFITGTIGSAVLARTD